MPTRNPPPAPHRQPSSSSHHQQQQQHNPPPRREEEEEEKEEFKLATTTTHNMASPSWRPNNNNNMPPSSSHQQHPARRTQSTTEAVLPVTPPTTQAFSGPASQLQSKDDDAVLSPFSPLLHHHHHQQQQQQQQHKRRKRTRQRPPPGHTIGPSSTAVVSPLRRPYQRPAAAAVGAPSMIHAMKSLADQLSAVTLTNTENNRDLGPPMKSLSAGHVRENKPQQQLAQEQQEEEEEDQPTEEDEEEEEHLSRILSLSPCRKVSVMVMVQDSVSKASPFDPPSPPRKHPPKQPTVTDATSQVCLFPLLSEQEYAQVAAVFAHPDETSSRSATDDPTTRKTSEADAATAVQLMYEKAAQRQVRQLIMVRPTALGGLPSQVTLETARLVARLAQRGTEDWVQTYRFHQVLWPETTSAGSSSLAGLLVAPRPALPTRQTLSSSSSLSSPSSRTPGATPPVVSAAVTSDPGKTLDSPPHHHHHLQNHLVMATSRINHNTRHWLDLCQAMVHDALQPGSISSRTLLAVGDASKTHTLFGSMTHASVAQTIASHPDASWTWEQLRSSYGILGVTMALLLQQMPAQAQCTLSMMEVMEGDVLVDLNGHHRPLPAAMTGPAPPGSLAPPDATHGPGPRIRHIHRHYTSARGSEATSYRGAVVEGLEQVPIDSVKMLGRVIRRAFLIHADMATTTSKAAGLSNASQAPARRAWPGGSTSTGASRTPMLSPGHVVVTLHIWPDRSRLTLADSDHHNGTPGRPPTKARCTVIQFVDLADIFDSTAESAVAGKSSVTTHDLSADEAHHNFRRQAAIRNSLSALASVMRGDLLKQAGNETLINYRASTLTQILQGSIDHPDARLVVMAQISPRAESYSHTMSTLRYVSSLLYKPGKPASSPFDVLSKTTPATLATTTWHDDDEDDEAAGEDNKSGDDSTLRSSRSHSSVPSLDQWAESHKSVLLQNMLSDPRQRLARVLRPSKPKTTPPSLLDDYVPTKYSDPTTIRLHRPLPPEQKELPLTYMVDDRVGSPTVEPQDSASTQPETGVPTPLARNTARSLQALVASQMDAAFTTGIDDQSFSARGSEPNAASTRVDHEDDFIIQQRSLDGGLSIDILREVDDDEGSRIIETSSPSEEPSPLTADSTQPMSEPDVLAINQTYTFDDEEINNRDIDQADWEEMDILDDDEVNQYPYLERPHLQPELYDRSIENSTNLWQRSEDDDGGEEPMDRYARITEEEEGLEVETEIAIWQQQEVSPGPKPHLSQESQHAIDLLSSELDFGHSDSPQSLEPEKYDVATDFVSETEPETTDFSQQDNHPQSGSTRAPPFDDDEIKQRVRQVHEYADTFGLHDETNASSSRPDGHCRAVGSVGAGSTAEIGLKQMFSANGETGSTPSRPKTPNGASMVNNVLEGNEPEFGHLHPKPLLNNSEKYLPESRPLPCIVREDLGTLVDDEEDRYCREKSHSLKAYDLKEETVVKSTPTRESATADEANLLNTQRAGHDSIPESYRQPLPLEVSADFQKESPRYIEASPLAPSLTGQLDLPPIEKSISPPNASFSERNEPELIDFPGASNSNAFLYEKSGSSSIGQNDEAQDTASANTATARPSSIAEGSFLKPSAQSENKFSTRTSHAITDDSATQDAETARGLYGAVSGLTQEEVTLKGHVATPVSAVMLGQGKGTFQSSHYERKPSGIVPPRSQIPLKLTTSPIGALASHVGRDHTRPYVAPLRYGDLSRSATGTEEYDVLVAAVDHMKQWNNDVWETSLTSIDHLRQRQLSLETTIRALTEERDKTMTECKKLEEDSERLVSEHKYNMFEKQKEVNELEDMVFRERDLRFQEVSSLKSELALISKQLRKDLQSREQELEELQEKLSKEQADRSEIEKIAEDSITTQADLEKRNKVLEKELEAALSANSSSQSDYMSLKNDHGLLSATLEQLKIDLDQCQGELARRTEDVGALSNELRQIGLEREHLLNDLSSFQQQVQSVQRELAEVRETHQVELSRFQEEIRTLTETNDRGTARWRARESELLQQIREGENLVRQYQDEANELGIHFTAQKEENQSLRDEIKQFQEELKRLKEERQALDMRNHDLEQHLTSEAQGRSLVTLELEQTQAELDRRILDVQDLTDQFKAVLTEKQGHETKMEKMREHVEAFKEETRSHVERLLKERDETVAVMQQTLEENTALADSNRQLQKAMEEMQKERHHFPQGVGPGVGAMDGEGDQGGFNSTRARPFTTSESYARAGGPAPDLGPRGGGAWLPPDSTVQPSIYRRAEEMAAYLALLGKSMGERNQESALLLKEQLLALEDVKNAQIDALKAEIRTLEKRLNWAQGSSHRQESSHRRW